MLCALLRFGAGAEFVQIPLFGISSVGIISGIVGVLTVLLFSISPARRRQVFLRLRLLPEIFPKIGTHPGQSTELFENWRCILGIHHAVSSPQKSTSHDWLLCTQHHYDFELFRSYTMGEYGTQSLKGGHQMFYSSPDSLCDIKQSFAKEVESRPYVKRVFGRMYQSLPAEYEGKLGQIDLISYENQQFVWAAEDLIAGAGTAVSEGNGVLTVFDKSNSLKVGDTIQLEQTELTVVQVLK